MDALRGKKIPILVQDKRWQQLFVLGGKPDAVISSEAELIVLLKKQEKLRGEHMQLKKRKTELMTSIVQNMEGAQIENANKESSKRLDSDKEEIDDVNERLAEIADGLLDVPAEIERVNRELMVHTLEFCYEKLRKNNSEADEIKKWIDQVRIDLKRNIIRKQNREINSRQIYNYMHDLFGPQILDLFDLHYNEEAKAGGGEDQPGDKDRADQVTAKNKKAAFEEKPLENFEAQTLN